MRQSATDGKVMDIGLRTASLLRSVFIFG